MLFENVAPERGYKPLPRFPAATRDLALICDDELPVAALEKAIREAVGKVLEEVSLFDVYRGEQVAEGKKSVAYSLTMRADDRTLTDEEADAAIKRCSNRSQTSASKSAAESKHQKSPGFTGAFSAVYLRGQSHTI